MAQQTTTTDRLAAPWNTRVKLRIAGATSTTHLGLVRNINKYHTLAAEKPFNEEPNNYTRRKNSLLNATDDDPIENHYDIVLTPEVYDEDNYYWQLRIRLGLAGGGADQEEILLVTDTYGSPLDPSISYDSWTRLITAADTNLTFSAVELNPQAGAPIAGYPAITDRDPANYSVTTDTTPTFSWTNDGYDTFDVYLFDGTDLVESSVGQAGTTWTPSALSLGTYWWRVEGHKADPQYDDLYELWRIDVQTARAHSSGFSMGYS